MDQNEEMVNQVMHSSQVSASLKINQTFGQKRIDLLSVNPKIWSTELNMMK